MMHGWVVNTLAGVLAPAWAAGSGLGNEFGSGFDWVGFGAAVAAAGCVLAVCLGLPLPLALSQASEKRLGILTQFLEGLPEGAFVADFAGTILWVNPALTKLTGFAEQELVGTSPRLFKSGRQSGNFYEQLWRTILAGQTFTGPVVNRRKDGTFVRFTLSISPVRNVHGQISHFVAVYRPDGSADAPTEGAESKESTTTSAKVSMSRAQDEDGSLNALADELEALASACAHDLRAPLSAIDCLTQVLWDDYAHQLDRPGRQFVEAIRQGCQRMTGLIDAMLRLFRISQTELQREPVDLSRMASEVAEELRRRVPERQVQWIIPPDLKAQGDPLLVRSLLENLLSNAWKFTANRTDARIEVGQLALGEDPTFFVRDNGVGFEPSLAKRLFLPFERLHDAEGQEGHGLGLAIVRRIVERHGGVVWAEGQPNQGATFYFTLPYRQNEKPVSSS